ncbi:MAG: holo-ACP synthase [Thermoleophilaceae bacterium]
MSGEEGRGLGGVGIDLVEPGRLEAALARHPALIDRLFTAGERAYADRGARPILHLAARFSAKEAVAKALRLSAFEWREIEVLGGGADARLALHGGAEERRRELGVEVAISLTHVEAMAGAVAALVDRGPDDSSRSSTKD